MLQVPDTFLVLSVPFLMPGSFLFVCCDLVKAAPTYKNIIKKTTFRKEELRRVDG